MIYRESAEICFADFPPAVIDSVEQRFVIVWNKKEGFE